MLVWCCCSTGASDAIGDHCSSMSVLLCRPRHDVHSLFPCSRRAVWLLSNFQSDDMHCHFHWLPVGRLSYHALQRMRWCQSTRSCISCLDIRYSHLTLGFNISLVNRPLHHTCQSHIGKVESVVPHGLRQRYSFRVFRADKCSVVASHAARSLRNAHGSR